MIRSLLTLAVVLVLVSKAAATVATLRPGPVHHPTRHSPAPLTCSGAWGAVTALESAGAGKAVRHIRAELRALAARSC